MGEFMKYLPITLIIVLGSSLFVALVINPVLTAVYMRVEEKKGSKKKSLITAGVFIILGLLMVPASAGWSNLFLIIGLFIIFNLFALTPGTKWFQNKFLPVLESGYERLLTFAMKGRRPIKFFLGMFGTSIRSAGSSEKFHSIYTFQAKAHIKDQINKSIERAIVAMKN